MPYFPIEIADDEIFVRYITLGNLKKGKLRPNDVFLDTRYPCVSLQRYRFCDEDCCKSHSNDLDIIGFLIFDLTAFKKSFLQSESETSNLLGDIVFSPMNEDNEYYAFRDKCDFETLGNPFHSDILYHLNNSIQNQFEIPRTSIREFSKKLFRNSLLKIESKEINFSNLENATETFEDAETILKANS